MPKVRINWKRADIVFGRLMRAFKAGEFPYNFSKPPQLVENLPKTMPLGGVEHARFLWSVCHYMRGGIRSDRAIRALSRIYDRCPDLFNPEWYRYPAHVHHLAEHVREHLASEGLNYNADEVSFHWAHNYTKLRIHWQSDPTRIFETAASYDDLCQRIIRNGNGALEHAHGFYGFHFKMVSMITYFFTHANLISKFNYPVPVDFHVLRMMVAHKLLTVKGAGVGDNVYSPDLLAAARKLSSDYCSRNGVESVELGDTMWLLSRVLCHLHPGNRTLQGRRNGRRTILKPDKVTWDDIQVAKYNFACGQCPVRGTCEYNIPAAEYYIRGAIVIRGKRTVPLQLFPLE